MQYLFCFLALLFAGMIHAQVPGSIRVPAAPSVNPLNPNGDGFITSTGAAFTGPGDETEFELPFIAVQQYENEPALDNQFAAGCQFYELVNDPAKGADAGYYYYKDPDGIALNGDELMIFRFRVARFSNGSTAFSFLLDTDYRFGFTGPEADPNAVPGNPGFEKEVAVFNNTGATGGVRVFNVDGTANATIVDFYGPTTSHYQVANALNNDAACTSNGPVFVDLYVPFSALGITSGQQVRMAVAVNEDIASSLGGGASDIGGIDGTLLPNDDDQFIKLINGISPVGFTNSSNRAPVATNASVMLDEHSPAGTVVHAVYASDVNGDPLTYSISGGNTDNTFVINAATGIIQVNDATMLNFESATIFQLVIAVHDGRLYDNAIITIQVRNMNEPPSVEDKTLYVDEDAGSGTLIHTVSASDPDAASNLSYSIVSGNTANAFSINSATGELTTNGTLDYESVNTFNLVIGVTDGDLADDAVFTIYVNNINEMPIAEDATVEVDENAAAGFSVTTIVASDQDAESVLQYSIVGGNSGVAFNIDAATGEITVNDPLPLNFEVTPSFTLKVGISDGILSDEASIVVNLNNVNEPPVIEDALVELQQPLKNNDIVYRIVSYDQDVDDILTFAIESQDGDVLYDVDAATGDVRIPDASLYNTRQTSTDIIVTATDRGGLSGSGLIQIKLMSSRELQIHPRKGFSPNGDGQNDFWFIEGIEAFPGNVIQVFNRWGVKVFQVDGYDNAQRAWAGEVNDGSARVESTYFFIITIPEFEPISGYVISKP